MEIHVNMTIDAVKLVLGMRFAGTYLHSNIALDMKILEALTTPGNAPDRAPSF
jgi:hypothetical protein